MQVQSNGKVNVATGIGTQGQGHFTVFAQIVADQLGVDVTDVDVVTGDTDQFYWGAGTFASRGAVVAGNAMNEAAKAVRQKILELAAEHFECAEDDLEIADGEVRVVGVPGQSVKLGALALNANPMRGMNSFLLGRHRSRDNPFTPAKVRPPRVLNWLAGT